MGVHGSHASQSACTAHTGQGSAYFKTRGRWGQAVQARFQGPAPQRAAPRAHRLAERAVVVLVLAVVDHNDVPAAAGGWCGAVMGCSAKGLAGQCMEQGSCACSSCYSACSLGAMRVIHPPAGAAGGMHSLPAAHLQNSECNPAQSSPSASLLPAPSLPCPFTTATKTLHTLPLTWKRRSCPRQAAPPGSLAPPPCSRGGQRNFQRSQLTSRGGPERSRVRPSPSPPSNTPDPLPAHLLLSLTPQRFSRCTPMSRSSSPDRLSPCLPSASLACLALACSSCRQWNSE